ncbi:MAG: chlorohydrolase [Pirellulaceae bacterium]|nr:MAG: chlorohydrolase [Pirellulaceae bacterium]
MDSITLRARFIIESSTRIHSPGYIQLRDGQVIDVGSLRRHGLSQPAVDLGDCVLAPAFINAHTHLEFSDLCQPLPPGASFADWIDAVFQYRQRRVADRHPQSNARQGANPLQQGLRECWEAGTGVVVDIASYPSELRYQWDQFPASPDHPLLLGGRRRLPPSANRHLLSTMFPRVIALCEVLGLNQQRLETTWQWAKGKLQEYDGWRPATTSQQLSTGGRRPGDDSATRCGANCLWQTGLSPHAPYSIYWSEPWLTRLAQLMSKRLVAMHVAESPAERQYLDDGGGPLAALWRKLQFPPEVPSPTLGESLRWFLQADRCLVVHGNYLASAELEVMHKHPGASIVFCPRTHRHFQHDQYPLRQMLTGRLTVVLGTDSRATNPDLDIWQEAIACAHQFPWLDPRWVVAGITSRAAKALGIQGSFGTLQRGAWATIVYCESRPHWTAENLFENLVADVQRWAPLTEFDESA